MQHTQCTRYTRTITVQKEAPLVQLHQTAPSYLTQSPWTMTLVLCGRCHRQDRQDCETVTRTVSVVSHPTCSMRMTDAWACAAWPRQQTPMVPVEGSALAGVWRGNLIRKRIVHVFVPTLALSTCGVYFLSASLKLKQYHNSATDFRLCLLS